jgi:hypothetical protein
MPQSVVLLRSGRANDIIKLPSGDRIHVKVATQDLFMTELLDAMKDIIVGKAAYVGRFRQ